MLSILQYEFYGNRVESYAWVAGIIIGSFIFRAPFARLINYLIYQLFRRFTAESRVKDFQRLVMRRMEWFLMLLVAAAALQILRFPEEWNVELFGLPMQVILNRLLWTLILLALAAVLIRIVDFVGSIMLERAAKSEDKFDDQFVPFFKDLLKVCVYITIMLLLLGTIFKLDITSVLAGLGIGGLAVAFAAQESLKDLFGSITIFLDKPFMVGDTVRVGEVEGTVEKVGFRSTRIRTYDQTFVTMPNKKMTESHVDNLTKRDSRRVRMIIGLSFQSSAAQLKQVIEEVKELLRTRNLSTNMVVALEGFGESSINLLIIYYTPFVPPEEFFVLKGEINFEIMEIISRSGTSFAFPVREVKLSGALPYEVKA